MAREGLGTTAIGNGIAIPHVRDPIVFDLKNPITGLCFLDKEIDLKAPDGKPVDTLFVIITSNIREHLYLLSRLSYVLNIEKLREKICREKSRKVILDIFLETVESQKPGSGL